MENNLKMKNLLNKIDLPSIEIKVFGSIKTNIHIKCLGIATAKQWGKILNNISKKVKIIESFDYNKINKKSIMNPSTHKIYLIGAII